MSPQRPADQLWALVPGWTRWRDQRDGGNLLDALVEALGVGLDAAQRDVQRLLDDMFVETCDERLVPLIGDLVGVRVDPRIPVARQRHQVAYAIHLRRRRGTIEALETLGWQVTGYPTTVREALSTQRTVRDPPLAARVNGPAPASVGALALDVTGMLPGGNLEITFDVARPVRRVQIELGRIGPDLYAVDPLRPVGLRRADGTPILRRDDPTDLVGPGRPIELYAVGADFPLLGELRPWFTSLPDGARVHVPDQAIAIDPERGRVSGPTGPASGLRAYRRYRLHFWQPLGAEAMVGAPAPQGDGVFTFAADSALDALTDAEGYRLLLAFEGERSPRAPAPDQRILVVREPPRRPVRQGAPFALLPPGRAAEWPLSEVPARAPVTMGPQAAPYPARWHALPLDVAGLNRLLSIEDEWGWDRFRHVRLVSEWGREPPPDDTVEIDVERGRFRVGPAHEQESLRVRYHRRHDVEEIKRRGVEAIQRALPLGRTATFTFRDTPAGPTWEANARTKVTSATEDPLS